MKTIFENMKGEWDWFGIKDREFENGKSRFDFGTSSLTGEDRKVVFYFLFERTEQKLAVYTTFSLADLLVNKSWCKARWGEGERCVDCLKSLVKAKVSGYDGFECDCCFQVQPTKDIACDLFSLEAFKILKQEGEKACIEYIKKTML